MVKLVLMLHKDMPCRYARFFGVYACPEVVFNHSLFQ